MAALLELRPEGLYCPRGGFHIDPWSPVARALITHAHGDHARPGSGRYLCAEPGLALLRARLEPQSVVKAVSYGEVSRIGDVGVSFHPAGHILGSAQIRIEADGEVWVVTGDFKRDPDPTCVPFEPVRCHTLITEATFALPIYRWRPTPEIARDVLEWWAASSEAGVAAVLFCYALGKAQRILAELALLTDKRVLLHGAMIPLVELYRDCGVRMLPTAPVLAESRARDFAGELILAPPSAAGSPWMRRFRDASTAFASGWMRVRGNRRRRGYDRGFTLSDHADWPSLVRTVRESGAERVLATHGSTDAFVAWLCEQGFDAATLKTPFGMDEEARA